MTDAGDKELEGQPKWFQRHGYFATTAQKEQAAAAAAASMFERMQRAKEEMERRKQYRIREYPTLLIIALEHLQKALLEDMSETAKTEVIRAIAVLERESDDAEAGI